MSNFIDRATEWVDRKDNESWGEWYLRALLSIIWLGAASGFMAGALLGFIFATH